MKAKISHGINLPRGGKSQMSDLKSKVAYLQGLSAGLDLNPESKEGKLLNGIIGVLDEFADTVDDLEDAQEDLEDYIETIDEDLFRLEDEIYENDLAGDYLEVDCPNCGETVCFDADILEDDDIIEVTCPNCDEVVFVNDDNLEAAGRHGQLENRESGAARTASETPLAGAVVSRLPAGEDDI